MNKDQMRFRAEFQVREWVNTAVFSGEWYLNTYWTGLERETFEEALEDALAFTQDPDSKWNETLVMQQEPEDRSMKVAILNHNGDG